MMSTNRGLQPEMVDNLLDKSSWDAFLEAGKANIKYGAKAALMIEAINKLSL